jgi:hypothetical protein
MAILVFSSNGKYRVKPDLATASTDADTLGKKIVVTSPITLTSAVTITGRQFDCIGSGSIALSGAGALTFGVDSVDHVKAKWFGANGNGVYTGNAAAINNAILAAQGLPVYLGKGTFIIIDPIELNYSTNETDIYQAASKLIGVDQTKTIIMNRAGDYAIKHTTTVGQAALSTGARFIDGELAHFSIKIDGSSPADSAGMKLASYWLPYIHDIDVSGVDGHGIAVIEDTDISENPDKYSCGIIKLQRVTLSGNAGWGIYADMWALTWLMQQNYISSNALGGVYSTGAGHEILDNAIVGNGTDSTSAGLHISYGDNAGTPHNVLIRENEFQSNWGTHLILEGYHHDVKQNRFIQDGTEGTGGNTFRNALGIKIGDSATVSYENNVSDNLFRYDDPGAATITAMTVTSDAGNIGNKFINNTHAMNGAGGGGITKFNLPSSRERNLAIESSVQTVGSAQTPYRPGQIAIGRMATTAILAEAAQILAITSTYDSHGKLAANVLTVAYNGILRIHFNGVFRAVTTANVPFNVYVYKTGVLYHTHNKSDGFAPIGDDSNVSFTIDMLVTAGDAIDIRAGADTNDTVFSIGSNTSTVTFEML